jgi:hypothetical protein
VELEFEIGGAGGGISAAEGVAPAYRALAVGELDHQVLAGPVAEPDEVGRRHRQCTNVWRRVGDGDDLEVEQVGAA